MRPRQSIDEANNFASFYFVGLQQGYNEYNFTATQTDMFLGFIETPLPQESFLVLKRNNKRHNFSPTLTPFRTESSQTSPSAPSGISELYIDDMTLVRLDGSPVTASAICYGNGSETSDDYRYGFNGMEADDEFKGTKNSYDFGARMYDPRVGRWLSIDPLAFHYPSWSPYNFVSDNPIVYIDPDGKKVRNADKVRLEQAKANNEFTNEMIAEIKQKGAGGKRRDFNGTKEEWKKVKATLKRYERIDEREKELIEKLEIAVVQTDKLIEEFKKSAPNLFEKVDNIKNEQGEEVDMMLGTEDMFFRDPFLEEDGGTYKGGKTEYSFEVDENGIVRTRTQFGVNTMNVTVDNSKPDREWFEEMFGQNTLNHECGHFIYS